MCKQRIGVLGKQCAIFVIIKPQNSLHFIDTLGILASTKHHPNESLAIQCFKHCDIINIVLVDDLSSGGEPERACIANLMFCHGTQIMENSRICHCLLFHEHGKQNFVQPHLRSSKLLRLHTCLD